MTRVLAFRHVPFEGIGMFADGLEGVQVDYADLYRTPGTCPDPASYDGLLFMGGPMSANDDLPFIHQETAIMAQAAARNQPVLGICLGAQLLAKALGATVRRNAAPEIGWFSVHLTEEGSQDHLLGGLDPVFQVFHWHSDTFDLPGGATHLAWSAGCQNQGFRLGKHLYGLQFHPEVTPEMIADWCTQDENCGDVKELQIPIDPYENALAMRAISQKLMMQWLVLVQK